MSESPNIYELIYLITAGPILTIILGIGLWQLRITKAIAQTNAKRESLKFAADQCEYYLTHIIPLLNKADVYSLT